MDFQTNDLALLFQIKQDFLLMDLLSSAYQCFSFLKGWGLGKTWERHFRIPTQGTRWPRPLNTGPWGSPPLPLSPYPLPHFQTFQEACFLCKEVTSSTEKQTKHFTTWHGARNFCLNPGPGWSLCFWSFFFFKLWFAKYKVRVTKDKIIYSSSND